MNKALVTRDGNSSGLKFFQSIRPLGLGGILRDAAAGVQLAAMNVPQVLGYTKIAGTPVVTGLYTLLFPLIAFAVFGSSRYLVVSADSATAAILAGGVSVLAPLGTAHYVELAGMVALLTGVFLLIARLLRLGFLSDFLSQTALVGFLTGVGFQVAIAVLGGMLGLKISSPRTLDQLGELIRQSHNINLPALWISVTVVFGILAMQRLSPKIPGSLIAVIGAIAASAWLNFASRGIEVIGPVAGGLPRFVFPHATWGEIEALVPVASSCFVMILAQSAATARIYAERHHQELDGDADILGLAAANTAAALSGTFVVNGSPTQTSMVESSGAKSQVAQIVTAVCVAMVLLFLTKPLEYLPRCALAAMVFVIALRLIDLKALSAIGRESPGEMSLATLTAAVVVFIGVEQGIILAMVLSLLRVVAHTYRPHTAVLVQDESGIWNLKPVIPGATTEPGIIIYRFGAALFYANAGFFASQVRSLVNPSKDGSSGVRWLIVDAGAITHVDYTAAHMLISLDMELNKMGVKLILAHVQSDLRPDLDRHHITQTLGANHLFDTLREALAAIHQNRL